jgi:hypothetical protein
MARLVFRPLLFLALHRISRPICVGSGDRLFGTGSRLWFRARHAARDGCP